MERKRGKTEKEPFTAPQTKPAYTEEYNREVIAHMASTGQSLKQTAAHFGVSAFASTGEPGGRAAQAAQREPRAASSLRDTKNGRHLQQPIVERSGANRKMKTEHFITLLCDTLEVSRSGCHAWASGANQRRARADDALRPKLRAALAATCRSYGYPRMTAKLRTKGEPVGKSRVARLMRE
ncbi:MAG: hypothetical protein RLZZ50_1230 [Verrucomicrobiota bacterium]